MSPNQGRQECLPHQKRLSGSNRAMGNARAAAKSRRSYASEFPRLKAWAPTGTNHWTIRPEPSLYTPLLLAIALGWVNTSRRMLSRSSKVLLPSPS